LDIGLPSEKFDSMTGMTTKKKPNLPRPWSPWEVQGKLGWIVVEPIRLAPLGGAVAGMVALAYFLLRQWRGESYSPGNVIVWVGLATVVGYAATGIFVWYLLHVLWRERLPHATTTEESDKNNRETEK